MKIKMLILAALIGAASLSVQAGVHFGFSIGLPLPVFTVAAPAPVVVVAPPVYAAPAYGYAYSAPVVVAAPPCPAPGYVWAPGYWSLSYGARVWVPGCWHNRGGYYHGGYGYHRW
jgi:hypothetical protein